MALLVRTPFPYPTESLLGYVLRISECNGYDTPWHILRLAGITQGYMQSPGLPVEKLALILGQAPSNLAKLAYQSAQAGKLDFQILQHSLGKSSKEAHLRLRNPEFCPRCVEETGHIDAFWDLTVAIACPKHHCLPVRCCPTCARPLSWFRPGLLTCRCGASLIGDPSTVITADRRVAEMMGILIAKLHEAPFDDLPNSTEFPIAHLAPLPLLFLVQIIEKLGSYHLQNPSAKPADTATTVSAAVEPLQNWPNGYHRFLANLGERLAKKQRAAAGLRKQFQSFYESMFKNRAFADQATFLREEFINFGFQHWGQAIVDSKLLRGSRPETERRYVSKSEYARRFSIWKPAMDRMIADGTVATKTISTGKSSRIVVDLEHTQLPATTQGIVTVRQAAKLVGLPVSVLEHLRTTGLLKTKLRVGHEQSWHLDDVEEFLQAGLALAASARSLPVENVELCQLMRLKLRSDSAKADVVIAAFDGRLSVTGRTGVNLAGLQLAKSQVDAFLLASRVQTASGTYSFQETAKITGLDFMAIAPAVELGLLQVEDRNGRRRIPVASVEQFNRIHIPLNRLAVRLGTQAFHLSRFIGKQGLLLTNIPRSNGQSAQPVVLREQEERISELWLKTREDRKHTGSPA